MSKRKTKRANFIRPVRKPKLTRKDRHYRNKFTNKKESNA